MMPQGERHALGAMTERSHFSEQDPVEAPGHGPDQPGVVNRSTGRCLKLA